MADPERGQDGAGSPSTTEATISRRARLAATNTDPIQLYASGHHDPRARRAADGVRTVAYALALVVVALLSRIGRDLDHRVADALTSFPGFLHVLWLVGFWGAGGWSIALLAIAAIRGRPWLALEGVAAAVLAIALAVAAAAIVSGDEGEILRRLAATGGPPVFPPGAMALTSAVIAVMAPYVTLPFRRLGRALIVAQLVGSVFLGVSLGLGAIAGVLIGLFAGSAVHLIAGSPGGLPTVTRVRSTLADLGVQLADLTPTAIGAEGVTLLTGRDATGVVEVKVYGRDAWDSALLADLWRRAWYRGRQRTARLGRGEYVEHEGFMSYLAAAAGVRTPTVVIAGRASNGDALIVLRPDGTPLRDTTVELSSTQAGGLWTELSRLHAAGIIHHRIDLDRVVSRADGSAGFSDLSSAAVRADAGELLADRAQLLALTALTTGQSDAITEARRALGDEQLTALLPVLQAAALPPLVRGALRAKHLGVDQLRDDVSTQLDAPPVELAKIRRVSWKSLLNVVLLAIAAYTLIGKIADLDLESFGRSLRDANWWWLLAALLIGQTPRVANAVSTMGSTTAALSLGPTTALQFATCYVNLAVPSKAGRVAITTRFYQRSGVPPAAGVSAGLIDSLSEFVVQVVLFVLLFTLSDVDLGLSLKQSQLSGIATTALIVLGVALVLTVITLLVPSVRHRVTDALHQGRDTLQVLRDPHKLLELYGGNLVSQVLFGVTLGACVRAFGFDVPLSTVILINTVVGLFAGLLPVPGGVGVTEAGLSLGLTRAGIPSDTAFAIALSYRFTVFYLPPIWGLACYRWLTARSYL